jgi:hypothetical protein
MPDPSKPTDPKALKKELKLLAHQAKMRKKQLKKEKKMRKLEMKQAKKEAKLRRKLAAKGIKVPPKTEIKKGEKPTGVSEVPESKLPEAEIVSEADVWTPKSAKKIDDIQKTIDRMDHESVKSLRERYKERYGENLEVPVTYETKASVELETAEEAGELEPAISTTTDTKPDVATGTLEKKKSGSLFARSKKAALVKDEKKVKVTRELRFFDLRTPLYLRDKFGASGGGGKRAILLIIDIILTILLFPVKLIGTIIYYIMDRRKEKELETADETAKPQPTS